MMPKRPRKTPSPAPSGSEPASPEAQPAPVTPAPGKLERMIQLLQRADGASLVELAEATGWQKHSVRGALAAGIPKKLGIKVISEKIDGVRRYRMPAETPQ